MLVAWSDGNESALDEIVPLVHRQLRRLAHAHLRRERRGHTLQTAALINEAYLRMIEWRNVRWQNRAHFFAVAGTCMRRILINYAKKRGSAKGGGRWKHIPLDAAGPIAVESSADLIALEDALCALEKLHPRQGQVVEMRFFAGMSVAETAAFLKIKPRTVARDWNMAQAWLYRELNKKQEEEKEEEEDGDA